MTRVPTYNSYMNMMYQTLNTKSYVDLYSFQAQTGLKAPTYAGYGMTASTIVGSEAALGVVSNFMENNKIVETEINAITTSLTSISDAINDFKSMLTQFSGMDLSTITPDYTGGEIVFGSNEDVYAGTTITINGETYTFTNDGDSSGNNIDLSTLTPGGDTYGTDVMNALKAKLQNSDAENFANFTFDEENNTFSFPLYTIDGESTLLDAEGVTTGEPHTMSDEQAQMLSQLQTTAFTTMMALTDCLNINVNGKYVFGGGVSTQAPVNFPFTTLEQFQSYYDGLNITYPISGNANLSNFKITSQQTGDIELINNGGNSGTIKAQGGSFLKPSLTANAQTTGDLTFNADKNTLQATEYGAFNTLNAGDTLVLTNAGNNNGSYVIESISADGKTITFAESTPVQQDETLTDGGNAEFSTSFPVGTVINMNGFGNNISPQVQVTGISADGTELYVTVDPSRWPATNQTITASSSWNLDSQSYYQGGDLATEKRISDNQSIVLDVTAKDGVFEKMFRALGLIAQGNLVDTRDPLNEAGVTVDPSTTLDRVEEALNMIQDAIYGGGINASAQNEDLYTVQAKMDSNTVLLNNVNENLTQVELNLQNNVDSLKNVDQTEASMKLLLAVNQLNASYSVLQTAMSTSLLNYL